MQLCQIYFYQKIARKIVARVNAALVRLGAGGSYKAGSGRVTLCLLLSVSFFFQDFSLKDNA